MKMPVKVLVLCTGNSCRSIIAEALINALGEGRFVAASAGSQPTGHVHPRALEVLSDHGIDTGKHRSKSWQDPEIPHSDLVITVCDNAAGEACPVWLADTPRVHWGISDPATARGSNREVRAVFDQCYRQLRRRIEALASLEPQKLDPETLQARARAIHGQTDN